LNLQLLEASLDQTVSISIIDGIGQEVYHLETEIKAINTPIRINKSISPGTYLVKIIMTNEVQTFKWSVR